MAGRTSPIREHVIWAMDFQFDPTTDDRLLKLLNVIDEYNRRCLGIGVGRHMGADEVIAILDGIVAERGRPYYIRLDNVPECISHALRDWCAEMGTKLAFIEPGSPWMNGKAESFNGRLRDEFLNGELFESVEEARTLLEMWRHEYNSIRPHSSLCNLSLERFDMLSREDQRLALA